MSHQITRLVLGCRQIVSLSAEEFERAWTAKEFLLVALGIEEKFDLVLENYAEFEHELLRLSAYEVFFDDRDWSSFVGCVQTVNRRLLNLLAACRLYIDQVKHDVSRMYGNGSDAFKDLLAAFSEEYDKYLGYRVLEALRNHVQHRSMPVHQLSYSLKRDERPEGVLAKCVCTPQLNVQRLKEEGNFKAEVLDELEGHGDNIDLKPLVREHVASLGRVHQKLRERVRSDLGTGDQTIEDIQNRFREAHGEDLTGLAVVARNGVGGIAQSSSIFDDLIKRRRWLERKNTRAPHFGSYYVSSEARGPRLNACSGDCT